MYLIRVCLLAGLIASVYLLAGNLAAQVCKKGCYEFKANTGGQNPNDPQNGDCHQMGTRQFPEYFTYTRVHAATVYAPTPTGGEVRLGMGTVEKRSHTTCELICDPNPKGNELRSNPVGLLTREDIPHKVCVEVLDKLPTPIEDSGEPPLP